VAKRTDLDLSGFIDILLAQNEACNDERQDSRVDIGESTLLEARATNSCSVVNLEITILISRISRYRLSKSCSRSCRLYQSLDLDLVLDCQDLDLNLVLEHNFLDLY